MQKILKNNIEFTAFKGVAHADWKQRPRAYKYIVFNVFNLFKNSLF